ncbi:MAG TPA: Gfo/Idh/MocA family oxidoreductase [Lacipirellulaceae bacterium]|jgi:predicted dehydrogenase|nr:Gfo/Idh/MocA family oxidoreductase [Lacipirellulaceae bacterium]
MIRIGIIGVGYWGPNLVRCFQESSECEVVYICDRDEKKLDQMCKRFPQVIGTTDDAEVLRRDRVDAVVIATPTKTHYRLAKRALEAGLHTFVEKPLATRSDECADLIDCADANGCTLFVGHVFLYSAAVAKLKEIVSSGELGEIYYISSTRLNLGPVRRDVNALWDLAPHDTSIILELMGQSPISVSCSGLAYLDRRIHDVCNMTMQFPDNRIGMVHVSWLDPRKRRVMTVVGSKKMAVYDDIEPIEKIRIYDTGVHAAADASSFGEFLYSYRYGDIHSPRINEGEPLKAEIRSFIDAIVKGTKPKTDGWNGLRVVEVIEAADKSLRDSGGHMPIARITPRRRSSNEITLSEAENGPLIVAGAGN